MKKISYTLIALFALIVIAGCPAPSTPEKTTGTVYVSISDSNSTSSATITITDSDHKVVVDKESVKIDGTKWNKELNPGTYDIVVSIGGETIRESNFTVAKGEDVTVYVNNSAKESESGSGETTQTTGVLEIDVYDAKKREVHIVVRKGSATATPIYDESFYGYLSYLDNAALPDKYYVTITVGGEVVRDNAPVTVTEGYTSSRKYNYFD